MEPVRRRRCVGGGDDRLRGGDRTRDGVHGQHVEPRLGHGVGDLRGSTGGGLDAHDRQVLCVVAGDDRGDVHLPVGTSGPDLLGVAERGGPDDQVALVVEHESGDGRAHPVLDHDDVGDGRLDAAGDLVVGILGVVHRPEQHAGHQQAETSEQHAGGDHGAASTIGAAPHREPDLAGMLPALRRSRRQVVVGAVLSTWIPPNRHALEP